MTSSWQHSADTLVSDLQRIFSGRLHSVVAYGPCVEGVADAPLTCLVLVESISVSDLEGCARLAPGWKRGQVTTPLILSREEFLQSLDAFPLEYGEIIRTHARVFGLDPFEGVSIAPEDARRACESQVKSHLVHLRAAFIQSGNRPQPVADLVVASAPGFVSLLRHVAQLTGSSATARADEALDGARAAGIAESVVRSLLSLHRGGAMPAADAARLFPDCLIAMEQLARFVDGWHA